MSEIIRPQSAFLETLCSVPPKPEKPKKKKPPTVERSIYFYRADAGADASGKPKPLDLMPALAKVEGLNFDDTSGRYWPQTTGDDVALWVDDDDRRFALATIRRVGLPRAEARGKLSSVPLAADQGLHEPIHMVRFDDNIIGVEFNFYGPRPSRLPFYLKHAIGDSAPEFTLEALLNQNVAAELSKQQELRLVDLQVRASFAKTLGDADGKGLASVLSTAAEASNAQVVGLTLRPEPRGRKPLTKKVQDFVSSMAQRDGIHENATRFVVKGVGPDGNVTELDLLEDRLVSRKKMLTTGKSSRAVKESSAYAAIEEAYAELKDELKLAAGISFAPEG